MIIYGWNSKELKQAPFPGQTCPACGAENSFIVIFASYFHVFWIPIFPYSKKLRIVCGACGNESKPKEVSEEVRAFAKQLKSKVRIPVWMFSGVGVVTLLIVYGIISSFINGQKELQLLKDPQVNDIYFFYDSEEPTEYKYYLRKVVAVRGDSIDISPNSFSYNMEPDRLEMADGFYDVFFTVHKDQMKEMYDSDELRTVKRGIASGNGFQREIVYPDSLLGN